VFAASALVNYFKDMARRVHVGLPRQDPNYLLVVDTVAFLKAHGGTWEGSPTELHKALKSDHKPPTPEALSRRLNEAARKYTNISYSSNSRWVSELGNQRRFVVFSLSDSVNGVNERTH